MTPTEMERLVRQQQHRALVLLLDEEGEETPNKRKRGQASKKNRRREKRMRRSVEGNVVELLPVDTQWYFMYISNPNTSSTKFQKRFRNRFRMSYSTFLSHLEHVKSDDAFSRWMSSDATGKDATPIELLLLGSLRYLGRAWTFDDLEEATAISQEVHRNFHHIYTEWGATTLFSKYVNHPTLRQAKKIERTYAMAGFPGCIGSGDGTHIRLLRCPFRLREANKSYKLGGPGRAYNTFVTHERQAMSSTRGHPAQFNDQTLIRHDEFANLVKQGRLFGDDEIFYFQLKEYCDDGSIRTVWYRGYYTIVDNGYLSWVTTVPPLTVHTTYDEMRWSKWLESMRKDVECFFGK